MLGWRVGRYVGENSLSASLLRKFNSALTLYQALLKMGRMAASEASGLEVGLCERDDDALFYLRFPHMRDTPGYLVAQGYRVSVILDLIRCYLGSSWSPNEIGIESRLVPPYLEELFPDSRICVRQQAGYLAIPKTCLHRTACSVLLKETGGHTHLVGIGRDYVDTLRVLIQSYLPDGYVTQQFAAELVDTSVRTLTRRLSAQNLTYGKLIDGVRFQVAKNHLMNPDMPISDIAQSVGFRDQADFTRMFRRVSGLTPKEVRKASFN